MPRKSWTMLNWIGIGVTLYAKMAMPDSQRYLQKLFLFKYELDMNVDYLDKCFFSMWFSKI